MMAEVFVESADQLSEEYLNTLLGRNDFWAFVALSDGRPVGGLTAHTLPMTQKEAAEILIYDLAVRASHQRRGIGRALVMALLDSAAEIGVESVFVPADSSDVHALDFYRALGGVAAPVTLFTFSRSRSRTPVDRTG